MGVIRVYLIEWLLIVFLFLLCIAVVLFIVLKIWQHTNGSWFELAFMDDLTRVYNQNAYRQKIRKLKVSAFAQTWLVLFDIDDFKKINDLQGHLHGDQMLVSAARRLRAVFFASQYHIYRIGGDEFVVLAEKISEEQLLERLLYLREVEKHQESFRFSKGYALIKKNGEDAVEQAFAEADYMLYADKRSKKC